jgi:hypothetical protein
LRPARRRTIRGTIRSLPIADVLAAAGSPVLRHPATGCWVRRGAKHRDAAYLWLLSHGEPARSETVAAALGIKPHALSASLGRDKRFFHRRPGNLWLLDAWVPLDEVRLTSALDVVLSMLGDRGPLPYAELVRETVAVYPVSAARVSQCLTSARVGRMADGRVGLVADGAIPIVERPPRQPRNVELSRTGQIMGVRVPVDSELLRGSGVALPRFVAWHLGLFHAPASRSFRVDGTNDALTVTRSIGGAHLTALRRYAEAFGAREGSSLVILLRLVNDTATVNCPRMAAATSEQIGRRVAF